MDISIRTGHARNQLIIVMLAIIFILVGWFVIKPGWEDLGTTRDTLAETDVRLNEKKTLSQNITKLLSNFEAQRSRLEILDDALPNAPEVPQLLSGLEELALSSGMVISSMNITEEQTGGSAGVSDPLTGGEPVEQQSAKVPELQEIKIQMSVSGSAESFFVLLSLLEQNLRLFDVDVITFTLGDGTGEGLQSFEMNINTYYKK